MIDPRVVVDMLAVAGKIQAVEVRRRARVCEVHGNVVANQRAAEVVAGHLQFAVRFRFDGEAGRLHVLQVAILYANIGGRGGAADTQRNGGVAVVIPGARRRLVFDDFGLAAGRDGDLDIRLRYLGGGGGLVDDEYAEGSRGRDADPDPKTGALQRRVEVGQRVVRRRRCVLQVFDFDTVACRERRTVGHAVRHDDPVGVDAGHDRRRGRRRYDVRGPTRTVLQPAIADIDGRTQVRVLPVFVPRRRQGRHGLPNPVYR